MNFSHYKMFLTKALHFITSVALFFIAWLFFRYGGLTGMSDITYRYNYIVTAGYAGLLLVFIRTYNAYLLGYSRIRSLAFGQLLSQGFSAGITWALVCLGWNSIRNPAPFLLLLAVQSAVDVAWSYAATGYYFSINDTKRTLLVYRNALDRRRFGSIKGKPTERLYKIVRELQYDGEFEALEPKLVGYDAVFVAGVNSRCRNNILKWCEETSTVGFFLPHVGDVIMQGAKHIQSFDAPVLYVNRKILEPEYALVKRAFDIVASGLGIVVLSPIMLVTAVAIRAYDHGPAIYRQTRLTKDGREFQILKFRSMRVDAERDGVARLSTGDRDERITPIGRVVRKCRLDELPQLVNIFKGDMSIVGPRPERPEIAEQYCETMPEFRLRLQVRAGLTGYAQVYGKYNTDPYEKLEFDLLYIKSMGVLTDLRLMFATVAVLLSSESTEGVSGVTALDSDAGSSDTSSKEGN